MSIRVVVCFFVVLYLILYAWRRNWFHSLCGAIVLMAFLEHPDMPRSIAGIPGLNLWNLLMVNIILVWHKRRRIEGLVWDFSPALGFAFALYLMVLVWAFIRCFFDPSAFYTGSSIKLVLDYLVNPLKFLLPALLLFDGIRSEERMKLAIIAILLMYFLLALQVIRTMGLDASLGGDALQRKAAKVLSRNVGFHRVDLSMMLAGASWAIVAVGKMIERRIHRLALYACAGIMLVGQALTGGRTGYVTWGLIGLFLSAVKWRGMLPLMPLAALIVIVLVPGVRERMLEGFARTEGAILSSGDSSEITSGRTTIWPYVIEKIKDKPIIGYGRIAMVRTGLASWLWTELREEFGHPHNAYLEMLLDNGILGCLCVLPIYAILFSSGLVLFTRGESPLHQAAGGIALSLLLALLIASIGAQTLYPREGVVGMWAALGIALRARLRQERSPLGEEAAFVDRPAV